MRLFAAAFLVGAQFCSAADFTIPVHPPGGSPLQLPVTVVKPDGPGPFPAVVILHDCSGLGPASSGAPKRWADFLIANGYAVAIPDSFSPRGLPGGVCAVPVEQRRQADAGVIRRAGDAYATLAYLRTLSYIDAHRAGVMGGSNGGSSTLQTMVTAGDGKEGFAAAIALYPECSDRNGGWRGDGSGIYKPVSPVLVLIGELDDWTPAEHCRQMAGAAQQAGFPVSLKVYPGAHHSFDSDKPVRYVGYRVNANAAGGHGATTGGEPAAWADSKQQVLGFFGRYLAARP